MQTYLLSLGAGLIVGVIYGLMDVRSPAPPVIALVGLLGILAGEQIVPVAKRLLAGQPLSIGWLKQECGEHVFGALPARSGRDAPAADDVSRKALTSPLAPFRSHAR